MHVDPPPLSTKGNIEPIMYLYKQEGIFMP